jgi:hypothetical protein
MKSFEELRIGSLLIRAPASWKFHQFEGIVLGRRTSRHGNLQISLAYASDLSTKVDHDACLDVLRQFMSEPGAKVEIGEQISDSTATFGSVTTHDAKLFRRYWYRYKNRRLVLALYQCEADNFAAASEEIDEANAVAASMELQTPESAG